MHYFIGVDVGTSSVRAGLYNENGVLIKFVTKEIKIYNFKSYHYEQSSNDIWNSVCYCINYIIKNTENLNVEDILSIGFDATCSLVVLDEKHEPVSVSESKNDEINIIMWMDHRSNEQANFINSTKHDALRCVGGKISPEMDPPKILWLKQNLFDDCYKRAAYFYSLPDYLFMKCTGVDIRSMCCVTCKWLYKANENEKLWDETFWSTIGLDDLIGSSKNFPKIGSCVKEPFSIVENAKLSKKAAEDTGLSVNTKVGVSLIDAHAGGVGAISIALGALSNNNFDNIQSDLKQEEILVLVSGTSSCHMVTSKQPNYVNGIWGPYFSAMLPNLWLNEAGQSASGKLIDFIIETHPGFNSLKEISHNDSATVYDTLHNILQTLLSQNKLHDISMLTSNLHVYPDFHGNRSPLADPNMKGAIYGLTLDSSVNSLALLYLACLQSLAYQTKHIIEKLNNSSLKLIVIIGGLAKNQLYCKLHSDICNLPIIIPNECDSTVLLGSCISGACNTEKFSKINFNEILKQFSGSVNHNQTVSVVNAAQDDIVKKFHDKKYKVFLRMIDDQRKYDELMND